MILINFFPRKSQYKLFVTVNNELKNIHELFKANKLNISETDTHIFMQITKVTTSHCVYALFSAYCIAEKFDYNWISQS